jgi:hypothetical protein
MTDEDLRRCEQARQADYELRCLRERRVARQFLDDLLHTARRRYWSWSEDPIGREDRDRRDRLAFSLQAHAALAVMTPDEYLKLSGFNPA